MTWRALTLQLAQAKQAGACSVLQRDSAVLVLLAPCCTLSPAGMVAVPSLVCVYGCALQRVWVMCYHCCAVCAA
jgi:hypothetical protein